MDSRNMQTMFTSAFDNFGVAFLPSGGGPTGTLPILVQPGTQIDTNFRAMHLDPSIWGPDAGFFRPERWEGLKPMWECIPFLGGRRMCPAQQMLLTQMA